MRKIVKLPSMSNVAAGAVATLNCPVGLTYECFTLKYTGVTLAQMTNIEVRVNGKTIQKFASGTELDEINTYHGRKAASGYLNIWQVRPELKALLDQRMTALGTADVQTLSLLVEIDAAATAPVLVAYALQSVPQPLGLICKVKAFPVSFATSGEQEIDNLPKSGARVAAIHLMKSDVSKVEVELDSIKVIETPKALAEELQTKYGKTPQTAVATHVDFLLDGDIKHAMATAGVQDFRVRPTIDTSGEVRCVVEYLDGYEGI